MKLTKKALYEMVKNDYTMMYKPMPKEWKEIFPVVTVEIADSFGLHFTTKHNGKMSGMISLSTTCKCNEICKARIKAAFESVGIDCDDPKKALREYMERNPLATNVSICGFCFSDSQQDYMTSMTAPLFHNHEILNNGIINKDWIPVINALYFRGESFGDFASENAVINFFNFAKHNKNVNFTAWTKNLVFFEKAIKNGHKKPRNFKIILSSRFINKQTEITESAKEIIDAIFTVYTKEYAKQNDISINCGARACLSCLRCYKDFKGIKVINEELK